MFASLCYSKTGGPKGKREAIPRHRYLTYKEKQASVSAASSVAASLFFRIKKKLVKYLAFTKILGKVC